MGPERIREGGRERKGKELGGKGRERLGKRGEDRERERVGRKGKGKAGIASGGQGWCMQLKGRIGDKNRKEDRKGKWKREKERRGK